MPWTRGFDETGRGLRAEHQPQQAQIHEQNRASQDREGYEMGCFDYGKEPERVADRLAQKRRFTPFEERKGAHPGSTTQPAAQFTSAGCGCRSQSNQL